MLRAVNILKVLSFMIFLGSLVLVYAYAPVMVRLDLESPELKLHKETFFYLSVTFFVAVNIALMVFQKLYERLISREEIKAWVRGFTFILNFYFALLVAFIGVINNTAHLSISGFSYLNYIGPFLILLWMVGLIFLATRKPKIA